MSSLLISKCAVLCFTMLMQNSVALNLGLIAGDNKHHASPLLIKKDYRHSPIVINVHGKSPLTPTLPPKPPPELKSVLKKRSPLLPMLPRPMLLPPLLPPLIPILPPILLPPLIPKVPLLPILPPILPSLKVSRLTRLGGPLSPIKVPILGKKSLLQKALGSELKHVTLPPVITERVKEKNLEKLRELRKKGALTTAEFLRFKKLLL